MKRIIILLLLQIVVVAAYAQSRSTNNFQRYEPVNLLKDKQEYQGYTIRLIPTLPTPESMDSYGFDILRNNKPVVHQCQNPLVTIPKGIQVKDDAYKVAQWMIMEFKKTGHWQTMVPPHIANELKLQTH